MALVNTRVSIFIVAIIIYLIIKIQRNVSGYI